MTPRPIVVGNLNVDMIMGPLPPWPKAGTECTMPHYELRPGGSAGNAALAFAGLGCDPILIANVGDDLFAPWLEAGMPMEKIVRRESTPTTVSVGITHPNGERTFFTNRGHLDELSPKFVGDALSRSMRPGAVVLFCAAYLTEQLAAAYGGLMPFVQDRGGIVALDTGWPPAGWTENARDKLRSWSALVDHLFLSEAEIAGYADTPDIDAAARRLVPHFRPGAALIVKCGAEGAKAWRAGQSVSASAPEVAVVDTIGAGDIFNAAYLAAIAGGATLERAVRSGVGTASKAVSTRPRQYVPLAAGD